MFCAIEGYVLLGEVINARILKEFLPYVNLESYCHIHKGANFDYILYKANLVFGLSQRFIDKVVVLFCVWSSRSVYTFPRFVEKKYLFDRTLLSKHFVTENMETICFHKMLTR